jgi:hypothetical protein
LSAFFNNLEFDNLVFDRKLSSIPSSLIVHFSIECDPRSYTSLGWEVDNDYWALSREGADDLSATFLPCDLPSTLQELLALSY